MGVGGNFWDLLKPYARPEGFDYLRNKRVAVDLSFWIVQHETAIRGYVRNPHLRLTFFRTINLFSKFGAYPVFVLDGTPSPLKAQARIARFLRFSGIDLSSFPVAEEGVSVERNRVFLKCIQQCVELLELLGMPVLKARGEAEALCAQLNKEGHVDACITADSDAFLYGAKCVIKCLRPNSKEPFECYHMSDIEAGLGLKRKHLIAISLLVGSDHDLKGVQGIGIDTAFRFVQIFDEDEILNRLHEISGGDTQFLQDGLKLVNNSMLSLDECSPKAKFPHCSVCGHPGSKGAHLKSSCKSCITDIREGCLKKPVGFKCNCSSCEMVQKDKEQKKHENWQIRVCQKIALEQNFPNDEIIALYMNNNHDYFTANNGPCLLWQSPKTEMLVDLLAYRLSWKPSYIRQRMLSMLSTIFLREMASNPTKTLLYGQYEFDSVQRVKTRIGHQYFVVKWKKPSHAMISIDHTVTVEESDTQQEEPDAQQEEVMEESTDLLDEPNVPQIEINDGCLFLLTDEDMELVRAAFPKEVDRFLQEKELKESKRKKKSSNETNERSESSKLKGVQISITEYYRSTKVAVQTKQGKDVVPVNLSSILDGKRKKPSSSKLTKSTRRRLLFN